MTSKLGEVDDDSHCHPIEKGHKVKLVTKSQKIEGEEPPPLIKSNCQDYIMTNGWNADDVSNSCHLPRSKVDKRSHPLIKRSLDIKTKANQGEDRHDLHPHVLDSCGVKTMKESKELEREELPSHINSEPMNQCIHKIQKAPMTELSNSLNSTISKSPVAKLCYQDILKKLSKQYPRLDLGVILEQELNMWRDYPSLNIDELQELSRIAHACASHVFTKNGHDPSIDEYVATNLLFLQVFIHQYQRGGLSLLNNKSIQNERSNDSSPPNTMSKNSHS